MAYTTIDKSSSYFNTKLYTGNGSTNAITGVGFQPDLIWSKNRGTSSNYFLVDVTRGTEYELRTNSTNHSAGDGALMDSFDSDGFTLSTSASMNTSSANYVSWNWLTDNTSGSSNTDGSITSTVSVNTTSGFSIVRWTGNGTAGATVGHGLGAKPSRIIVKDLGAHNESWWGYHKSLGATKNIYLNASDGAATSSAGWNDTEPTSSVFTLGNYSGVNASGYNFIAYCWTDIKGFSKFGSYTGNGNADGTFVYTGFKPAYLLVKQTSSAGNNWVCFDNKRLGYNVNNYTLYPNTTAYNETAVSFVDLLSNGFKYRATESGLNGSGSTYIYHAFAEHPLVSSSGVPCTAR